MSNTIQTICSPTAREIAGLALSVGATGLLIARANGGAAFRLLLGGLAALAVSFLIGVLALVAGVIDPQSGLYLLALVGLRVYVALPLLLVGGIAGVAGSLGGRIVSSGAALSPADADDARRLRDDLDKKQEHLDQARHHIGEQAAEVNRLKEKLRETLDLLLTSEEKFRTLFETGHDGCLVIDLEKLTILQANPRLAELTGYEDEELTGRPLADLCDEETRNIEPERLRELLIRGRLDPMTLMDRAGAALSVRMSFSLVNVGGEPVLMGIAGDVSESVRLRQELELKNQILQDGEIELREANDRLQRDAEKMRRMNERLRDLQAVKDGFLSTVSHELRTPLTSIRSFSEILLSSEDASDDERREFLAIIHSEAERLTRLVNDVLDLAKIEAGQMSLELGPVDLNLLTREVVRALAPLAQENSVTVESRVPADIVSVRGDRDRLHQVLTNLLSNALKYSPKGTVVVLSAEPNDEGMIEVCLEDEGPGIPKDEMARIFEKFRQVDDTMSDRPAGTGLGLAICREIITLHGGRVWVRSVTGRGASFFFTVPVAKDTGAPKKKMSIADKVRAAAEMARRGETSELDLDVELILKGGSEDADAGGEPEPAVAGVPEIERPLTAEISGELPPLARNGGKPGLPPMPDA